MDFFQIIFIVALLIAIVTIIFLIVSSIIIPILKFIFPDFHNTIKKTNEIYLKISDIVESMSTINLSIDGRNYNLNNEDVKKYELNFYSPIILNLIKIDKENSEEKLNYWFDLYNKHTLYLPFRTEKDIAVIKKMMLSEKLNVNFELRKYSNSANNGNKVLIIDLLFKIATKDGNYSDDEDYYITATAKKIGMGNTLFQKIKSRYITDKSEFEDFYKFIFMFGDNSKEIELKKAYEILKIPENTSKEIAKAAYLKLVKQHHPDKVAYLGKEYVEKANLMIQKINAAYDLIENN